MKVPARALTALALLCAGPGASAAAGGWDPALYLRDAAWSWSVPQAFDLPGSTLRVQHFTSRLDPADTARRLTVLPESPLDRLLVQGRVLWLSGMAGGRHWLVQLVAHSGGTRGVASGLTARQEPAAGFDARAFVPGGGRNVFRMAARAPGSPLVTRMECSGDPRQVGREVMQRLLAARWKQQEGAVADLAGGEAAAGPGVRWRHPSGARLSVLEEPGNGSLALTFWYLPPGGRP